MSILFELFKLGVFFLVWLVVGFILTSAFDLNGNFATTFATVLTILSGIGGFMMSREEKRKKEEEKERKRSEAQAKEKRSDDAYENWLNGQQLVPIQSKVKLMVLPDEILYFKESNVELYEATTHTATETHGSFTSASMNFDDVSIGGGDLSATSVQHQWDEQKLKATGELYLTNRRIAFVSEMQTRSFNWEQVLSCTASGRYGLCVCVSGVMASQNFLAVGARIYADASRILRDPTALLAHHQESTPRIACSREETNEPVVNIVPSHEELAGGVVTTCPACGQNMELPGEVIPGQHILCPFCSAKFSYLEEVNSLERQLQDKDGSQKDESGSQPVTMTDDEILAMPWGEFVKMKEDGAISVSTEQFVRVVKEKAKNTSPSKQTVREACESGGILLGILLMIIAIGALIFFDDKVFWLMLLLLGLALTVVCAWLICKKPLRTTEAKGSKK